MQHGADPNFESLSGECSLDFACLGKKLKVFELLIAHGADVSFNPGDSRDRRTVLQKLVDTPPALRFLQNNKNDEYIGIVRLLVKEGASIDGMLRSATDKYKNEPDFLVRLLAALRGQ